jgi:hypothetical protein
LNGELETIKLYKAISVYAEKYLAIFLSGPFLRAFDSVVTGLGTIIFDFGDGADRLPLKLEKSDRRITF